MNKRKHIDLVAVATVASLVLAVILIAGTMWVNSLTRKDTEGAVRSVSLFYLDELAGRREQVVENNLNEKIETINIAISLMTEEDLSDKAHLEAYQQRMKQLYRLSRFAFVDTDGLIYTSSGYQNDIDSYAFDYKTLSGPEISILNLENTDKSVIIAVPVNIQFQGKTFTVCFMAIEMDEMLSGVSLKAGSNNTTFCNIYTSTGVPLTESVLGGLSADDNLLAAMNIAEFEAPYTHEQFVEEFENGTRGVVSFTYKGIRESLSYIPVRGTDWQLTYLIRESVINERINSITSTALRRGMLQSALTAIVILALFGYILWQMNKNNQLLLEHEKIETENRVKQEELEHRLALQEKLLEEERHREQQDRMITALAADYWSVYYIELDKDAGVCYQEHSDLDGTGFKVGEHFDYLSSVTAYANHYITEQYRDEFLSFIQPENIREALKTQNIIAYTYMVHRHGRDSFETVRFARVHHSGEDADNIDTVGACFVNVDAETRKNAEQQQILSDALTAAEEANKAKTAFLSNMSHEIRTPMNAIIGLDSIALNDPDTPPKTREYLEKIGSSADHLLGLINDILDMSRIESGRLTLKNEEFSFRKLIEAINTMFSGQCQDKGLEYNCSINSEIDDYYIGDNMKLRQVLINILGNAVKFTPEGGKVNLDVERTAKFDGKSTLRFIISDTGIGMSKDFIPRLFDTFSQEDSSSTSKYGSTGLGMAITKSIVEMMNGTIEVESEKGVGSTFTVTVTLSDSDRTDMQDEDDINPSDMTVLIIDDDPVACQHAQLVLEKAGISSEIAGSGKQALEMVKLRHARMEPYNLILVDWKMPDMDGIETTREIRKEIGHESAIVILTAYRWDDVLEEALQAGVDSFLPKPLFAAAVMDEFKSALKKKDIPVKKQRGKVDLNGRHVLLAEDVDVNAEIILMILQMRGITTDRAENGKIAVDLYSKHPEGYYDAVLMDMRMPEMDGLEATRLIRASGRSDSESIPIIALTANAFDEDVQRSMQAGLNAHLSKPVQPEILYETLETLIKD